MYAIMKLTERVYGVWGTMGGKWLSSKKIEEMQHDWATGRYTKNDLAEKYGVTDSCVVTHVKGVDRVACPPCDDGEEWRPVKGYEERYLVSSHGRLYMTPGGTRDHRLVSQCKNASGHQVVRLGGPDGPSVTRVDKLVARAFLDGRDDLKFTVDHIDGDLTNNSSDNLVCHTMSKYVERVTRVRKQLLDDEDVADIRNRWLDGEMTADIAESYGVSYATAYKCLEGLRRDTPLPEREDGEEWAEVEGYSGRYCISSHGRLFTTGDGRRKAKIMRPSIDHSGYLYTQLCDAESGRCKTYHIHRLVAAAFCDGRTDEKDCVNHIDGNTLNNHADNLEWCTLAYNTRHAASVLRTIKAGDEQTHKRTKRTVPRDPSSRRSPFRRFTDEQVAAIRSDHRSAHKVAEAYGVNKCTILSIRSGKTYKDI